LVAVVLLLLAACAGEPVPPSNSSWISPLRAGGYVVLLRHGATDWRQGDDDMSQLANCATQRNLDARGREQAAAIGEGIRALNIPIGKVETSEYCRCIETARIAFGYGTASVDLTSVNRVDPAEALRRVAAIRERIAAPPDRGTNTVLVSHMAMIREATGVALEEGEAAVFQPADNGAARFVGRITPEQWTREAQSVTSPAAPR
jgi:broad specificity phosphatase PhoE